MTAPVQLGRHEKQAGRLFRAACQAFLATLNLTDPPGGICPPTWAVYRHECPGRGSVGIVLRAKVIASRPYWVCYCGAVGLQTAPDGDFPHEDCDGGRELTPAGFFTFTWKEGGCRACGLTVRSTAGLMPPPSDSAPRERQASAHPGDPGQPRP